MGIDQVEYVGCLLFDITRYFDQIQAPCPTILDVLGTIVGIKEPLDIKVFWKNQSISFDWEYMFAKTDYNYEIEKRKEKLLAHIAALANEGLSAVH